MVRFFKCLLIDFLLPCSGKESEFTYDMQSKTGPDNWGNIKPEWHLCKKGSMQSPIDLLNDKAQKVTNLGELKIKYKPSKAIVINSGHDIMVSQYQKYLIIFMKLSIIIFLLRISVFECNSL